MEVRVIEAEFELTTTDFEMLRCFRVKLANIFQAADETDHDYMYKDQKSE